MSLPARADITSANTAATGKAAIGDLRDFLAAQLGGQPRAQLEIVSGNVSAETGSPAEPVPHATIETEGGASTDSLNTITTDQFEDGQFLMIGPADAAHVVTLVHAAGGAGQMSFVDGVNLVLWDVGQRVVFHIDKSSTAILREVARYGFDNGARVYAKTASYQLKAYESGATFTNLGAAGSVTLTLPTARAGLRFLVAVQAAQVLQVVPGAGDEVLLAGTASATGYEADAVGEFVELIALDATTWLVRATHGTWTAV